MLLFLQNIYKLYTSLSYANTGLFWLGKYFYIGILGLLREVRGLGMSSDLFRKTGVVSTTWWFSSNTQEGIILPQGRGSLPQSELPSEGGLQPNCTNFALISCNLYGSFRDLNVLKGSILGKWKSFCFPTATCNPLALAPNGRNCFLTSNEIRRFCIKDDWRWITFGYLIQDIVGDFYPQEQWESPFKFPEPHFYFNTSLGGNSSLGRNGALLKKNFCSKRKRGERR